MSPDVLDTMIGSRETAADPQAAVQYYNDANEHEANGEREAAIELLRKATDCDDNPKHNFKLAYLLDLVGEEDESMAIYEQICEGDRPHMNALLNLAVLYEDRGEIGRASCRERV